MDEQIIELYAHVARTACLRMTPQHLAALQSSLDQTSCLSARLQWDRKATAHAEMFNLLADAVAEALPSSLLSSATGRVHDLMITVGPAADGIALNTITALRSRHPEGRLRRADSARTPHAERRRAAARGDGV
jgi:hypothetical protein